MLKQEFLNEAKSINGITCVRSFGVFLDQVLDLIDVGGDVPLTYKKAIDKMLKAINVNGNYTCIGDAVEYCSEYGFVFTVKYHGNHGKIYCYSDTAAIERMNGFRVLANFRENHKKNLEVTYMAPLWNLSELDDNYLFRVFSEKLEEVAKEQINEVKENKQENSFATDLLNVVKNHYPGISERDLKDFEKSIPFIRRSLDRATRKSKKWVKQQSK